MSETPLWHHSSALSIKEALVELLIEDEELSELAPGGVWSELAPRGQESPHVVYQLISTTPAETLGDVAFERMVVQVKVVGDQSQAVTLEQARVRIRELVEGGIEAGEGVTVGKPMRGTTIDLAELIGDDVLLTRGDRFTLFVAAA